MQKYIEYYADGSKRCEGQLMTRQDDGSSVRQGVWKQWSETGVLVSEERYALGKKKGHSRQWYDCGTLLSRGNYDEDKKHGFWETWYENGQKESEAMYEHGLPSYMWQWFENGRKKSEQWYDGTMRTGVWKYWNRRGQLYREIPYSNNAVNGMWREWYDNSGAIMYERMFVDGQKHGISRHFYRDGTLANEDEYHNGDQHGYSRYWYENGQMSSETWYVFDRAEGVLKEWYENGQLSMEITYVDGRIDGMVMEWYRNGQMKSRGDMYEVVCWIEDEEVEKTVKSDRHLVWYSNGQLSEDIFYQDGVPVEGTRWNQDGTVAESYSPPIPPAEPVVVPRETKHTCLILHDVIPSGDKYMMCSFSEEHVHDYNALQSFLRAARQTKATCQYCTNPMKEEIYQQP
jgi:antitoxin component YwqK of YwqJK toxin-antitoxin module